MLVRVLLCSLLCILHFGVALGWENPATEGQLRKGIIFNDAPPQTLEELRISWALPADAVAKRLSSLGVITCNDGKWLKEFTGFLIGKTNIVATAAHGFLVKKTCKPFAAKCTFKTVIPPIVEREILANSLVRGDCEPGVTNLNTDWAVAELELPIPHAIPFLLPQSPVAHQPDEPLLQASAFDRHHNGPRFAECKVLGTNVAAPYGARVYPVVTNCPSIGGMSGSPQMKNTDGGFTVQSVAAVTPPDAKSGRSSSIEFYQFTASVPLAGGFWKELNRRIGEKARQPDSPPLR